MKKSVSLSIHFGLWLFMIFLLLPAGSYFTCDENIGSVNSPILKALIVGSLFVIPAMISFYSLLFYTKLIIRKKWLVVFPIAIYIVFYLFLVSLAKKGMVEEGLFVFEFLVITIFIFGLLGSLYRFQLEWFKNKQEKYELEKQNNQSKMALLRSQINPHFLFNTLHNIDTLIHTDQKSASESLIKLSDIMRYMLKDAKHDLVDLQKEIEHIESYLSLEQLRLKNEKFLNSSINGNFNGIKIAPMIMIPFVENAFKHSVDSNIDNGIEIEIRIENHKLIFGCKNKFDKSEVDKDKSHGIGLDTVKKRLDLIYPNKHKLTIDSVNQEFIVNLEINLNEN